MKIGFVVNDIATEQAGYTTIRLAMQAANMGYEAWIMGLGDLAYDTDEKVYARARSVEKKTKDSKVFLRTLQGDGAVRERICVNDLDILMLRNNPADDAIARPWAQNAGIDFGRMAMTGGVIVLNDPDGLARANNKMYFQGFPEEVRPRTLITRDRAEIKAFTKEMNGRIILKPLTGSGGQGVFYGTVGRPLQPESDRRDTQSRWLRDRPGVSARCC